MLIRPAHNALVSAGVLMLGSTAAACMQMVAALQLLAIQYAQEAASSVHKRNTPFNKAPATVAVV